MFGPGYAQHMNENRDSFTFTPHELERQRVIDHVSAQLRSRLNSIIGSPINPNTMDIIQRETQDALNGLRSQGISDLNIAVEQNPSDRNGFIVSITHQGLQRRDHINNSFGESPVGSLLGTVVAQSVALEEASRRTFAEQSLLSQPATLDFVGQGVARTIRGGALVERDSRINVDGLRQLYTELGPEDRQRILNLMQEIGSGTEPPKVADTSRGFTPQRKLDLDDV